LARIQARIREDDEHLAVVAGMDLIARLDCRAAREPQDVAAAEHERVAVRAQHFSGRFRARGQSERGGAKCDAENPQQTRQAHARISRSPHVSLAIKMEHFNAISLPSQLFFCTG